MFLSLLVLLAVLVFFQPLPAQTDDVRDAETAVESQPIRVVTKSIEPFVFIEEDIAIGFSMDLWHAVAEELALPYEIIIVDTVEEQLESVVSGDADVGIAAISITSEREAYMDFSFPYFESGLGILVKPTPRTTLMTLLAAMFSPTMRKLLVGLAILVLFAGHLVWLLERKNEGDFSKGYWKGISEGIWWAAATVTTVGYGDHVPRRSLGRAFGLFWMLAGVFILANFTANVTTELTVNRLQDSISGPQDLPGKRIVAIEGSTADQWLGDRGLPHRTVSEVDDAYEMVLDGTVQAFVYDYPVLLYYTLTQGGGDLEVAGEPFNQEDYGIAFPYNSPLREDVNVALLKLYESGVHDEIATRWFGVIESQ